MGPRLATDRDRLVRWAVLGILVLNACWIFMPRCFVSLDGWAHLQTARILINGPDGSLFCANPATVPNQTAYRILGALQAVLPPLLAERVLLALIILMLGVGTWMLARAHGKGNPLVLLVLPFTYNYLLLLGFHNFLLGLGLALLFAALWMRARRLTWTTLGLYVLASFLLFYTHPMAVAVFFLLCGAHEAAVLLKIAERERIGVLGRPIVAVAVFAVACVPAALAIVLFNADQDSSPGAVDRALNLRDLIDLRSLVLFDKEGEMKFLYALKLILVAAVLVAGIDRFRRRGSRRVLEQGDVLLFASLVVFAGYFTVPDSAGFASYITVRLQLIGLLLFIAWLSVRPLPLLPLLAPVPMVLLLHNARCGYVRERMEVMEPQLDLVQEAAEHIPVGSTVLPILIEEQWLLGHLPSMLGAVRDVNVLCDYECSLSYFPLVWCATIPAPMLAHFNGSEVCLDWLDAHTTSGATPAIDHIVVLGYPTDSTSCAHDNLDSVLMHHYRPTFSNRYARVFERSE